MEATKTKKRTLAGRDERGRLLPGHRLGGRPKGPEKLSTAFVSAGTSMAQARLLLVQKTLELAEKGDRESLARLDRWTMPQQRPLAAGLFRDTKDAAGRAAALRAALDAGEVAPHEAALVTRTLEHEAASGEWREVQQRLDALDANPAPAPGVVVRHVDAGVLPAPSSARLAPAIVEADAEPDEPS